MIVVTSRSKSCGLFANFKINSLCGTFILPETHHFLGNCLLGYRRVRTKKDVPLDLIRRKSSNPGSSANQVDWQSIRS